MSLCISLYFVTTNGHIVCECPVFTRLGRLRQCGIFCLRKEHDTKQIPGLESPTLSDGKSSAMTTTQLVFVYPGLQPSPSPRRNKVAAARSHVTAEH